MKTPCRVQEKSKRLEKLQCQVLTYLKKSDNVLMQDCNHFGICWVTNLPLDMCRETHYKRQVQSKRYSVVLEMPLATSFFVSLSISTFFFIKVRDQLLRTTALWFFCHNVVTNLVCSFFIRYSHTTRFTPFPPKYSRVSFLQSSIKKPLEIIESIFQNKCEKNYLHKHRSGQFLKSNNARPHC